MSNMQPAKQNMKLHYHELHIMHHSMYWLSADAESAQLPHNSNSFKRQAETCKKFVC